MIHRAQTWYVSCHFNLDLWSKSYKLVCLFFWPESGGFVALGRMSSSLYIKMSMLYLNYWGSCECFLHHVYIYIWISNTAKLAVRRVKLTLEATACPTSPLWGLCVWALRRSTHTEKYQAVHFLWRFPERLQAPSKDRNPPWPWIRLQGQMSRPQLCQRSRLNSGPNSPTATCWRTHPLSSTRLRRGLGLLGLLDTPLPWTFHCMRVDESISWRILSFKAAFHFLSAF